IVLDSSARHRGGPDQRHDRVARGLYRLDEMRDAKVEPTKRRADRLALRDGRPRPGAHEILPYGGRGHERVRLVHEAADRDAHARYLRDLSCMVRVHRVKFPRSRSGKDGARGTPASKSGLWRARWVPKFSASISRASSTKSYSARSAAPGSSTSSSSSATRGSSRPNSWNLPGGSAR